MPALTPPARTAPALTGRHKAGLALAALLGVVDIVAAFVVKFPEEAGTGGPDPVAIIGLVTGALTLIAVAVARLTQSRRACRVTAVTRLPSAILGIPAFFFPGVPAPFVIGSAVGLVLTVLAVALLVSRR